MDPDPDPESQNNADLADPDPKHCLQQLQITKFFGILKGTVSKISSEPPCKDDNVRFTMIPFILSYQKCGRNCRFFLTRYVFISSVSVATYEQGMHKSLECKKKQFKKKQKR